MKTHLLRRLFSSTANKVCWNLKYLDLINSSVNNSQLDHEHLNINLVLLNNPESPDLSQFCENLNYKLDNIWFVDGAYNGKSKVFSTVNLDRLNIIN